MLAIMLATSCSTERKVARFLKRNPDARMVDTITVPVYIKGDTFIAHRALKLDSGALARIQSLVDSLRHTPASISTEIITRETIKQVKIDPLVKNSEHYSLIAYLENGAIRARVEVKPRVIEKRVPVEKIIEVKPDKVDNLIKNIKWIALAIIAMSISGLLMKVLPEVLKKLTLRGWI